MHYTLDKINKLLINVSKIPNSKTYLFTIEVQKQSFPYLIIISGIDTYNTACESQPFAN